VHQLGAGVVTCVRSDCVSTVVVAGSKNSSNSTTVHGCSSQPRRCYYWVKHSVMSRCVVRSGLPDISKHHGRLHLLGQTVEETFF
jgi:hypothetical protein